MASFSAERKKISKENLAVNKMMKPIVFSLLSHDCVSDCIHDCVHECVHSVQSLFSFVFSLDPR